MSDRDLDQRLRDSGRALRETAPDRHDVAAALADVTARRAGGSRWVAPTALVGIAAVVVGLLVWIAQPADDAEPPAPADSVRVGPNPVDSTASSVLLDADWSVDQQNWDGRGGRCITVIADGGRATGCVEGGRLGVPLWAAIGREPMVLEPTTDGYTVGRVTFSGDLACDTGLLQRGRLHEFSCGMGVQQARMLPETPVREFTPVVPGGKPSQFEPIRVDGVRDATAYLSRPLAGGDHCLVLLVDDQTGWREACEDFGDGGRLAVEVADAVWIVDIATGAADRISIARAATSSSVHGCYEAMPTILGSLDRASMANALVCSGEAGMMTTPRQAVTIRLEPGARPRRVCFGAADCDGAAALGSPLPIAPGDAYPPNTREVAGIEDLSADARSILVVPRPDATDIGSSIAHHYDLLSDVTLRSGVHDFGTSEPLVLVEFELRDKNAGNIVYAVWTSGADGNRRIDRVFRIRTCDKGSGGATGLCD